MANVLVVDDSSLDRKVAATFVEQAGFTPVMVENGLDALRTLEKISADIVLTDLQMPEMDGLQLVEEIKERFPAIPVVLMTARGSEEIAVTALQKGAASYIPKKDLKDDLEPTLLSMQAVAVSRQRRQQVFEFMDYTESNFVLGYDPAGPPALISYFQDALQTMNLCGESEQLRVGTALTEAITNAISHGNLELDSILREGLGSSYWELGHERSQQEPYRDRRVHVTARLTNADATYVIRDEGPGFDPSTIPDPTDPENLMKASGRGLLLIQTFMDDVSYNEQGNEITMTWRRKP